MEQTGTYPFEIKEVGPEETEKLFKYFSNGLQSGYVRVSPKGYMFSNGFKKEAEKIYNLALRHDDTWVLTFPKSGTTWMQELVWMLGNDFDYELSEAIPLVKRFPFLEMSILLNNDKSENFIRNFSDNNDGVLDIAEFLTKSGCDLVADLPSPRFIKSHLPLSLLPPSLLDLTKVIYVARDPRDVAVSYYHHNVSFKHMGYTSDLKNFWNLFIENLVDWTPYFEHVKEAWENRHHPNLLFIFYEEMLENLPLVIERVAKFLGKRVLEEQIQRLCEHLSFQNFRENKSCNFDSLKSIGLLGQNETFVRSGKSGGWRDYFDSEMIKQAEQWMAENLKDTDLQFPSKNKP